MKISMKKGMVTRPAIENEDPKNALSPNKTTGDVHAGEGQHVMGNVGEDGNVDWTTNPIGYLHYVLDNNAKVDTPEVKTVIEAIKQKYSIETLDVDLLSHKVYGRLLVLNAIDLAQESSGAYLKKV